MSQPLSISELTLWLEWAGSTLLSIGITSPLPRSPHVLWPDYPPEVKLAYGYSDERLRPIKSSAPEIQFMDELLLLPNLIRNVTERRIVNARLLVTPLSSRYLYSWTRLAIMLHMDRRGVAKLHEKGLREIIHKLDEKKIHTFRQKVNQFSLSH
jgi:hypothetical protein